MHRGLASGLGWGSTELGPRVDQLMRTGVGGLSGSRLCRSELFPLAHVIDPVALILGGTRIDAPEVPKPYTDFGFRPLEMLVVVGDGDQREREVMHDEEDFVPDSHLVRDVPVISLPTGKGGRLCLGEVAGIDPKVESDEAGGDALNGVPHRHSRVRQVRKRMRSTNSGSNRARPVCW
jgi:hypothetical protein